MRYALGRRPALTRSLDDGRIELGNNPVEGHYPARRTRAQNRLILLRFDSRETTSRGTAYPYFRFLRSGSGDRLWERSSRDG
jgi:hypothetical protein